MLSAPDGLSDVHRTVFYRLITIDTALRYRAADDRAAAARNASFGN